jgi:5'-nucleotidase
MEASLLGVPSIALSLATRQEPEFGPAARFARALVEAALTRRLPPRMLLNVNVPPDVEPDGYTVTRLGRHSYGNGVIEKVDPRGRKYYWIGGNEYQHEDIPGSDCKVVYREQRVSVTPLQMDLTDAGVRMEVMGWSLSGFRHHPAPDSPGARE